MSTNSKPRAVDPYISEYYNELLANYERIIESADIPDICLKFNQKLTKSAVKIEASEYYYALIEIYRGFHPNTSSVYKPKSIPAGVDTLYLTYDIFKLESDTLRGIIVAYMIVCLPCI